MLSIGYCLPFPHNPMKQPVVDVSRARSVAIPRSLRSVESSGDLRQFVLFHSLRGIYLDNNSQALT